VVLLEGILHVEFNFMAIRHARGVFLDFYFLSRKGGF